MLTVQLADEDATVDFGAELARALVAQPISASGLVIYLQGELGAGKTTLCRGILNGLGHRGAVKSPTYTLVETYSLPALTVHHFDLYRLHDPEELEFMGIRDYFCAGTIALVEWPQRGGGHFPQADLQVELALDGTGRVLTIVDESATGLALLNRLKVVLNN